MVGTLVMAPKSVTFRRHDHLVSVLFGDLLRHSYNITFSMFLYLVSSILLLILTIIIWTSTQWGTRGTKYSKRDKVFRAISEIFVRGEGRNSLSGGTKNIP